MAEAFAWLRCRLANRPDSEHAQDNRYALSFLEIAREIAGGHHEKWDGSGYPQGLAGNAIPLSARLMALADVYDAIISRRVYKDPIPHAAAVEIIREESGQQFDPTVVQAFLELADRFREISETFRDEWP